ncbi:unnamed protein product [Ambrosiozyma monospora]|uniref:Unnamed protein product n=1 Tax=Ambrosiozyma monospora TaxID=43982 RepID=A0ACB5T876_AMBMO|nr:unnamed protein product [Ambrosiozyma monospora]
MAKAKSKEAIHDPNFVPPSVTIPISPITASYYTPIPSKIQASPEEPVILGVDEAGRGPVLGPMVYGIAYCLKEYSNELKKFGFADSKTLTDSKRRSLLQEMCNEEGHELFEHVGWAETSLTARDISSGMLKPKKYGNYNLNEQAHDATIDLIKGVLERGVNLKEVYVDTVGPPATYQKKLEGIFPGIKITVAKKADATYPIVSTASVVAKVTRDISLEKSKEADHGDEGGWGSGYPSDPNTSKWLNGNVDPLFGWDLNIRFSWQTTKDSLTRAKALNLVWEDDLPVLVEKSYGNVESMLDSSKKEQKLDCSWFAK